MIAPYWVSIERSYQNQKRGEGLLISIGSLLRRGSAPLIGLDISSSAIKLVELNQDRQGNWILERCASEPLAAEAVVDGSIERFDDVAETLERLLKKSGTPTKNIALALPNASVITKKIVLPGGLSDQELEVHVEAEASQYIPFPLEEVSLDFCVTGIREKGLGDVEVLLAATRKEKVEALSNLAVMVGLSPVVVDIDSYAARLAVGGGLPVLPHADADILMALVKVGRRSFSLQVIRNDDIVYESEQGTGGALLTQMIARQYGISEEEAELKKCSGDLPADYQRLVAQSFLESMSGDIARALQFFYTSTPYQRVQQIYMFGGSATVQGLAQAVQQQAQVEVNVLNPFEGMILGPSVNPHRLKKDAAMYVTACGLAMRRFLK